MKNVKIVHVYGLDLIQVFLHRALDIGEGLVSKNGFVGKGKYKDALTRRLSDV